MPPPALERGSESDGHEDQGDGGDGEHHGGCDQTPCRLGEARIGQSHNTNLVLNHPHIEVGLRSPRDVRAADFAQ